MISDFCAFPALGPSLLPLRLSDTGSVAKGGAMGGMLPKAVHWLLHQHSGTLALRTGLFFGGYRDSTFEWLLLLLFIGLAKILGQCTDLADVKFSCFDVELAFKVFITLQLLEQGIKLGPLIIDSKIGETCEFGKGACLGESWRAFKTAFLAQDLRPHCTAIGFLVQVPVFSE